MSDINAKITRNDAYVDGYQSGFKAGYGSADMSIPGMVLCGIGILALIISCIMVMRHSSRVVSILCKRFQLEIPKKTTQKLSSIILALIVCASLVSCASKKMEQADQLYADNVSRMAREYRGIMLYHLLTAQHLLSKVGTASAELGRHASGNKLNIGQQVYRITRPSAFVLNPGKKPSADTRKGKGRI